MCKGEEQAVRKGRDGKIKGFPTRQTLYCSHCKTPLHATTAFSGSYCYNKDLPEDNGSRLKVALDNKIRFQPGPLQWLLGGSEISKIIFNCTMY